MALKLPNKLTSKITRVFIVILALAVLKSGLFTVKTGEVAIVYTFGKITDIKTEGLNFKIPFVQTKDMLETREKSYIFAFTDEQNTTLEVSTKDMQSILIEFSVQASIFDPEKLWKAFNGKHESRFIRPRVQEIVQSSVSKYTIEEFITKRTELSRMIFDDLKDDFETYGLTVSNISIINHDFSDEYEAAVEAKKVAEQSVERSRAEQEKLRVEAQNKVELAKLILQEKELVAKANRVESESLSERLIQKQMLEKWNGELPKVTGNSSMILDSSWMKAN